MSNVKCRKIKKKALMNQCGELTCNCKSEMDAFVALMNPDAGEAVASCTIAKKKPTYKLFCDEDSSGTHDAAEASQTFKVKCRNGGIRKNKFDQLLCGNAIIGGDGWEAGPGSMVPGLTCAAPGAPFTARRKRKIKSSAHSKIVGGQIVNRETTWPWIVRLPGCGGSIITQNPTGENDWILTAAHCCEGETSMTVLVGSEDRVQGGQSTDTEFVVNSISIIEHPDYNGSLGETNSAGADVCLVEVPNLTDNQPIGCTNCWAPACIPAQDAHVDDKRLCYVGGWGTTSFGGSQSTLLRDVGVHAFPQDACTSISELTGLVKDNEFCAGVPDFNGDGITDGGKDSCQGDSGGPLVCEESGTAVLYGIVSWGFACADPDRPGVYAKTASFSARDGQCNLRASISETTN